MSEAKLIIDGEEFGVNVLRVRPTDVLVIRTPPMEVQRRRYLRDEARRLFKCDVAVVPQEHELSVVQSTELEPSDTLFVAGRCEPCRIFDANGLEWKGVVECDTATGELICYERDSNGRIFVEERYAKRVRHKTAAPLRIEPLEK